MMDINMIMDVLYILGMILLGGLAIWYKGNATLRGAVAELITKAEYLYEDSTKMGGAKFTWVVNKIYEMLPLPLRSIIGKQMIEQIVQGTFDAMANYAKMQLDRVADKATDDLKG